MEWLGSDNRAIAIIRVSSDKQTDNYSHETQQTEIDEYCARHKLMLIKCYRITESAKPDANRKQYDAAFAFALRSKIRHVVFYMQDREARNMTDTERNEILVRKDRLVIHYARDRKVLWAKSATSEFMMRDYCAINSKYQVRTMADKVADALLQKAISGHYPGARPPRGYRTERLRNEHGTLLKAGAVLVPDPETAPWIRREFELRAMGLSLEQIRLKCIEEGIVPAKYVKGYHKSAVDYRLRDPIYYGRVRWKGIEYPGKHELIIPPAILRQVEAMSKRKRGRRIVSESHGVFAGGWIACECGCSIVYDPKVKRNKKTGTMRIYHYYRCSNGKKAHKTLAGRNITEAALWEQFEMAVSRITVTPKLAKELAAALNRSQEAAKDKAKREAEAYRSRVAELEADEDRAYDHLKTGILDADLYRRQMERIRIQKREAVERFETSKASAAMASSESARSIIELALNARKIWKKCPSTAQKKLFLEKVLSNPILRGLSIEYELKKPFLILEEMGRSGEWLGYLDEFRTSLAEYAP